MTTSGDLLRYAASIVDGARNETHGDKQKTFAAIAAMMTIYLRGRGLLRDGAELAARDASQMQVLVKVIRGAMGRYNLDDYIDQCGYSAISGELAHVEAAEIVPGSTPRSNPADFVSCYQCNTTQVCMDQGCQRSDAWANAGLGLSADGTPMVGGHRGRPDR